MALTPPQAANLLMQRPELNRFGPSKLAEDTGAFKTLLTSQLGASREVLGNKFQDPLKGITGADYLHQAQGLPLMRSVKESSAAPGNQVEGLINPSGRRHGQAVPANQARGQINAPNQAKGQINSSNQAMGAIDLSARHPDDLGHLPGPGHITGMPQGFTKEEENLLFAAAAAESKFLAAKRQAMAGNTHGGGLSSGDKTGALSAAYESGSSIDAIGYDGKGGTSYGLYQIASGVGTMGNFLHFLQTKAPDIAKRLAGAGPANSGSRAGSMASEWKRIASENPKRFEDLQHEFIRETHYEPALKSITLSTGVDLSTRSQAVREVLWSTAVQHGPNGAAEIFSQALDKIQSRGQPLSDKALIEDVYSLRMNQFGGRHGRGGGAVASRLADERESALAMLTNRSLG
jgi:hypothetical protein